MLSMASFGPGYCVGAIADLGFGVLEWTSKHTLASAIVLVVIQLLLLHLVGRLFARRLSSYQSISRVWLALVCLALALPIAHVATTRFPVSIAFQSQGDEDQAKPEISKSSRPSMSNGDRLVGDPVQEDPAFAVGESSDVGFSESDNETLIVDGDKFAVLGSDPSAVEAAMDESSAVHHSATDWEALLSIKALVALLCTVYFGGVLVFSLKHLRGVLRLWRLRRRATPLGEESRELLLSSAKSLSLSALPSASTCRGLVSPLTCGVLKPVILLPAEFGSWSTEQKRLVLTHELAHVRRLDVWGEFLARAMTTFFWVHPSAWKIADELRTSRELATDELVVDSGADPVCYANCLLAVLERISSTALQVDRSVPGVAMCATKNAEQRIQMILNSSSCPARQPLVLVLSFVVMGLAAAFSSVHFRAVEIAFAQEKTATQLTAEKKEDGLIHFDEETLNSDLSLIERVRNCVVSEVSAKGKHGPVFTLEGTVTNPDGSPAAGATVVLRESAQLRFSSSPNLSSETERALAALGDVFGKATTDKGGKYRFEEVVSPALPQERFRGYWRWDVIAVFDDGFGRRALKTDRSPIKRELDVDIDLEATNTIEGRVVGEDGEPLSQALVLISSLSTIETMQGRDRSGDQDTNMWLSNLAPVLKTDAKGSFTISGVPKKHVASVLAYHPDFVRGTALVATSDEVPLGIPKRRPGPDPRFEVRASPVDVEMESGKVIAGVATFEGRPVTGAKVRLSSGIDVVNTDGDGRFELKYLPFANRPMSIYAAPPKDSGFLPKNIAIGIDELEKQRVDVEVEFQRGVRITGTVTSGGEPVSGVTVYAKQEIGEMPMGAKTDENGAYNLVVAAQSTTLFLASDKPGYLLPSSRDAMKSRSQPLPSEWPQQPLALSDSDVGSSIQAELFVVEPTESIKVRARLPNGQPASLATVEVKDIEQIDAGIPSPREVAIAEQVVLTDGGSAELKLQGVPTSKAFVVVRQIDESGSFSGKAKLNERDEEGFVSVELKEAITIQGRVLLNGKPIKGARVSIGKSEPTGNRGGFRTTNLSFVNTDNEGVYRAAVDEENRYSIFVQTLPGVRGNPNRGRSGEPNGTQKIEIEDFNFVVGKEEIVGRVVDASRSGIAGVRISVRPSGRNGFRNILVGYSEVSQLETDAEGNFHIRNLPAGSYELTAYQLANAGQRSSARAIATTGEKGLLVFMDSDVPQRERTLKVQAVTDF